MPYIPPSDDSEAGPTPALNPFTERWAATAPSDTREEAVAKEKAFQDAQKISREIDERLMEAKKVFEKKKKAAQILLLGACATTSSALLLFLHVVGV
jgi:membrane-bound lytic murein transglycosylase MltF